MAFIDIVLGVFLIFGLIRGLRNGLIIEFASLISLFLGIYLAVRFSCVLGDSKMAKVTTFVIILIMVVMGIHLLAKVLSKVASTLFLGWLNKLGGAFLGVIKTALFLGVVLSLLQKVNINNALISKKNQEKSLFYSPILKTSEYMLPVLTHWFKNLEKKI